MSRPVDKMETLASEHADKIYITYPHESGYRHLTYAQTNKLIGHTANILNSKIASQDVSLITKTAPVKEAGVVVAIIAEHGATMLLNIWGIMKLNCVVFPLSPRNSQEGLIHLLKAADARYLVSQSGEYRRRAEGIAAALDGKVQLVDMVEFEHGIQEQLDMDIHAFSPPTADINMDRIASILHTSGSTKLPKPIFMSYNTQHSVTKANFMPKAVTIVTTGLIYHSMGFWICFCGLGMPNTIVFMNCKDPLNETPEEVLRCIEDTKPEFVLCHPIFADAFAKRAMAGDERVIRLLKTLMMINATGSKLSPETAHALRSNGVPLVSTYAGTEITFALNFDKDGQSYDSMKPNPEIPIRWEDVGHENPAVKELIVGPNPGLAVGIANLPGGWYATNDLFEELPLGSNSWVHIGRKDQMMIHSMGLNTPPEPIETFITSDTCVRSVLVVGHNRPLPGVVIEPDWPHIEGNDDDLKQYMWNLVESLNSSLPAHSRISQHTIYILPQGSELPRTDKNSIKRGLAATLYEKEIDQMYKNYEDAEALSG